MNTQRKPVQYFQCIEPDFKYIGSPYSWVEVTEELLKSSKYADLKKVLNVKIVVMDGYDEVTVIPDVDTPEDWQIRETWPFMFKVKVTPHNQISLEMGWVDESIASYIDRGIQFWGFKIK